MQFWEDKSDIVQKLAWQEWEDLKEELQYVLQFSLKCFKDECSMYDHIRRLDTPKSFGCLQHLPELITTLSSKLNEEYQSRADIYLKDIKKIVKKEQGNEFEVGDFKIRLPRIGYNRGPIHCNLKTYLLEGNQQIPKNILKNVKRFISQDDFMKKEGYKPRKETLGGYFEETLSRYYPIEPTVKEMERLFKTMNKLHTSMKRGN